MDPAFRSARKALSSRFSAISSGIGILPAGEEWTFMPISQRWGLNTWLWKFGWNEMKPQNLMVNHLRKWPFWAVNPHFTAICIGMIFRIGFGSVQLHRSTVPLLLPVLLRCRLHPDGRRSTVIQASNGSWGHKTYDGVAMETHLIRVCSRLLDGSLSAKEAAWLGNVPQLLLLALFLLFLQ